MASNTTIELNLFDKVASKIVTTTLSETNTQILVNFSEELNTFSNWVNGEPNNWLKIDNDDILLSIQTLVEVDHISLLADLLHCQFLP